MQFKSKFSSKKHFFTLSQEKFLSPGKFTHFCYIIEEPNFNHRLVACAARFLPGTMSIN